MAHQLEVLNLLAAVNTSDERTIVLVLHVINHQAAQYSNQIIAMRNGQILVRGIRAEVITEQTVAEVFGVSSVIIDDPVSGTPSAC
jgi:iron complex transport system ATP-binding protein